MKQKLKLYALWAEILGGVAILISLLFVGVQISQSNAIATTDALKEGTDLWTDALVVLYGTEESTSFFAKAINHCDELSKAEHGRFMATLSKLVSAYDNIYNQYDSGMLREEVFISVASAYYSIANTDCAQEMLSRNFPALPRYLMSPSEIEALSGHEETWLLPSFLIE